MNWGLRFLGVGNSQAAPVLGSACAVLERENLPVLMIDCGQEALSAYSTQYGTLPMAIFITHLHLDHIGGLERLFFSTYFDESRRGKVRLYVPAKLVPLMQTRLADYPGVLAEGGANWWDAFQLIPVSTAFWHEGLSFEVFAVRHHQPESAFGLRLPGSFIYSGDTRPIPELLATFSNENELIAHDCGLHGNPSHTGLEDIRREYPEALWPRLRLYHYASHADADVMREAGFEVVAQMQALDLAPPKSHELS